MDKITYLAELAEGLARWVPERERQDILRYYAEYFDEAGPDRVAEVVQELGDPWALASRLAVEGGYVTQERANSWTPPKKKKRSAEIMACVAIAMIVIVVAVASLASRVGAIFGNIVGKSVSDPVAVIEGEEYAGFVPVEPIPGVIFSENEMNEVTGGIWSMEDGNLDAFYDIDADISLGSVTVTEGVDYSLAIQYENKPDDYEIIWEIRGDTLKIRDNKNGKGVSLNGLFINVNVQVIVTVPEGTVLRKVDAKTALGNIYLADLDVEVKVTGKTNMGNVDGCNIRTAQKVELKTNMGNVTFGIGKDDLYSGMDIDLETDMGNVEAQMECYESELAYELETDMGRVSVNGVSQGTKAERKGASSIKLEAESSKGNVDVFFLDDRWQ